MKIINKLSLPQLTFGFSIFIFFLMVNCGGNNTPALKMMPDMYDTMAVETQEVDPLTGNKWNKRNPGGRVPHKGTTPIGFVKYNLPNTPAGKAKAGKNLSNPLVMTKDVLVRGERNYQVFCEPCHAADGSANRIPMLIPGVMSLTTDYVIDQSDGEIFHTITKGSISKRMGSYESQISIEDRWALIHYLRLLQKYAK